MVGGTVCQAREKCDFLAKEINDYFQDHDIDLFQTIQNSDLMSHFDFASILYEEQGAMEIMNNQLCQEENGVLKFLPARSQSDSVVPEKSVLVLGAVIR